MGRIRRRFADAPWFWRALTAAIAAVGAVAGSFAYTGFAPAFIGRPASVFVVDTTPAAVVNTVKELLGVYAQPASFGLGLALTLAVLGGALLLTLEIEVTADVQYLAVPLGFLAVFLYAIVTGGDPLPAIAAALPAAVVIGAVEFAAARDPLSLRRERDVDPFKRATIQAGFGLLTLSGLAYLVGSLRTPDLEVPYLEGGQFPPQAEAQLMDEAADASWELPGAPGLVSEIGEFYTVDINSIDPIVDQADWELELTGLVDTPVTIDYDTLREEYDAVRFFGALRCVGEELNDELMDMAVWTGVPMAPLLEEAQPGGDRVVGRAADDYWNTIEREELEESYLVYGMNGRQLPREHGHPVRLFVPGNWGEVNVKWVTELEFIDGDIEGYWQERGWEGTGEVNTVAKLWSVDRHDDGTITVGGHAYAGTRGVDRVEVSTDGAETWTDAELGPAMDGRDVWRQWRHTYEPASAGNDVVVRCYDGTGTRQTAEETGPAPDGPRGWVERSIDP